MIKLSIIRLALLICILTSQISCKIVDLCPCGYSMGNTTYTDLQETDFTTITSLLGPASGWQLQEYIIPPNQSLNQQFARQMTRDSLIYSNDGLKMLVKPSEGGTVTGAEIATPRSDIHYGSFRAALKTTNVNGTCGAFFWFFSDSREVDVEILSRQSPPVVNLVIHSDSSAAQGFNAAKTPSFFPQHLAFDPSEAFHEYRIDWSLDSVKFLIDGVLVHTMKQNIPTEPGRLFLNHWSNGSPDWTSGPPNEIAVMQVLYVKAYFNSSDPKRVNEAQKRCSSATGTMQQHTTCIIPDQLITQGGVLPAAPASSGTSNPSPDSSWNDAVDPNSSWTGIPIAIASDLLPVPGQVPFLSSEPGNVLGEVYYNVTYNCTGCPTVPNDANVPISVDIRSLWWLWIAVVMISTCL